MKDHSVVARGVAQRKCEKCGKKKPQLQRAAIRSAPESAPPTVNDVLRLPAQSLDAGTRAFMREGMNISRVEEMGRKYGAAMDDYVKRALESSSKKTDCVGAESGLPICRQPS